jgi:hypothetical protein
LAGVSVSFPVIDIDFAFVLIPNPSSNFGRREPEVLQLSSPGFGKGELGR